MTQYLHLRSRHICDRFCTCPVHQTKMYYHPRSDQHACTDPDCEYAIGYEENFTKRMFQKRYGL